MNQGAEPGWVELLDHVTVEVGSFCHGVCRVCSWQGPGRRSRRVALRDYQAHAATAPAHNPLEVSGAG